MNGESGQVGEAYLTAAEVARRLECSVSLVQKWRRLGWLPATRLGPPASPVYGYLPSDVERFAATRWNRRRGRPPGSGQSASPAHVSEMASQAPPSSPAPPAKVVVHTIPPVFETAPEQAPKQAANPPSIARPGPSKAFPAVPAVPTPPPLAPRAPGNLPPRPLGVSRTASTPISPRPDAMPARTGRPLVLWDADPRQGTEMLLARFPAAEFETALATAATWSRRYPTIALGEAPTAGTSPNVLALWKEGKRVAVGE